MKRIEYTALLLLLGASTACTDLVEPFYAESYEVVRVEARAMLNDAEQQADLKAEIEASVLEAAPVKAGGGYRIEYIEAFSGPLTVYPAEEVQALKGVFTELTTEQAFVFQYAERKDTCRLATYNNEDEEQRVLFNFDLTPAYRARYPDAGIVSVVREEYTATWAH